MPFRMALDAIIRPFSPSDLDTVRYVHEASYGPDAVPPEQFKWWVMDCPVGQSGFMVVEYKGEVIATQPMRVMPARLNGQELRVAVLTHVVVHPAFRRKGVFSALIKECEARAWSMGAHFLMTMPNDKSMPGFIKMRYRDPGDRLLMVYPLSLKDITRKLLGVSCLAVPATAAGNSMLHLFRRPVPPRHAIVTTTESIPENIEEITRLDSVLFPGARLLRPLQWWRWRYTSSPTRHYTIFEKRTANGSPVGVAVTTSQLRDGIPVVFLVDWAVADLQTFQELVHALVSHANSSGCCAVCAVISSLCARRELRRAGFVAIPSWAPLKHFHAVYISNPQVPAGSLEDLQDISNWHLMLGDWDNI